MSKAPIIGLSPMDGVTDTVMRQITRRYGRPDVMTTEFVNVEGWHFARARLAPELVYDPSERPLVAQIYGLTPAYFADITKQICQLGFAAVEINFGCPAKSVVHSGAGAAMINTPERAQAIYEAVRAVSSLPVYIKTRLGYQTNTATDWLPFLLRLHPDRLTIHGRTLKQGYTGQADWATIAQAVAWRDELSPTTQLFGNGDLTSRRAATARCQQLGLDGALIGRAALGNPWLFADRTPSATERAAVALEHCQLYEQTYRSRPKYAFFAMRKHLAAYISHFPEAKQLRLPLMQTNSVAQVAAIFRTAGLV